MYRTLKLLEPLIFKNAPIGIAVINIASGRIQKANSKYCQLIGRSQEQTERLTWMNITHSEDIVPELMCLNHMRREGLSHIVHNKRYIKPDFTIVYAQVHISLLDDCIQNPLYIAMVLDTSASLQYKERLRNRSCAIQKTRDAIYHSLAIIAQFRDRETGEHLNRTCEYVKLIYRNLPFKHPYSHHGIESIAKASTLHDIGKVAIPDSILLKTGMLSEEEMKVMRTHTTIGAQAIKETMKIIQSDAVLTYAHDIARFHHERWDGTGYPDGLSAKEIPLAARIMAVADVYDALRSQRVYKTPLNHDRAQEIMCAGKGKQFDPVLLDTFFSLTPQVISIFKNFG